MSRSVSEVLAGGRVSHRRGLPSWRGTSAGCGAEGSEPHLLADGAAGAIKAAGEFCCTVDWNAPALEIDAVRQIEIVDAMINRRVAGIVLAPVDKQALVAVVERAGQKGIPVAIFDSAIDTDKIVSDVATDNTEAGRIAARRMGEILGGKGKVGIVGFMPGSASTMEREHGFPDEIRQRFPESILWRCNLA